MSIQSKLMALADMTRTRGQRPTKFKVPVKTLELMNEDHERFLLERCSPTHYRHQLRFEARKIPTILLFLGVPVMADDAVKIARVETTKY